MSAAEKEIVLTPAQLAAVTLAAERFLRAKGMLPPDGPGSPPPAE